MKVCPKCGSELAVSQRKWIRYSKSGLKNVFLEGISQYRCRTCRKTHTEIPAVEELNFLISLNLVFKQDELTGAEVTYLQRMVRENCWHFVNRPIEDIYRSGPMIFKWTGKVWEYA